MTGLSKACSPSRDLLRRHQGRLASSSLLMPMSDSVPNSIDDVSPLGVGSASVAPNR